METASGAESGLNRLSTKGSWMEPRLRPDRARRVHAARYKVTRAGVRNATYMTYIRSMSENAVPLPYEVQEMTTTEARKRLPELVNMAAYGHVTTVLVRDGRRLARIVPEEDAWVYSPVWQDKLREAEADLAAGRVQRFDDDDEFLGHLDALADEAGG
jgi:antitoxin (DNA-binding transcriptional repressor) of toxin-antitoxin stability system